VTELKSVLDAVQARVPYLRCSNDATAERDGWIGCASLLADPDRLRAEIDATAAGRQSDDPQVLASLFVQSYAFRIPSITVAAWALGLPVPSMAPETTLMRITRHRPGEVAIAAPNLDAGVDAHQLVARVLDDHLDPFLDAVLARTRVGQRLLLGNVAASLAAIFRAVQSSGPLGDGSVRERADAFFAAGPQLTGLGTWDTITVPGAFGWYWDRSACCLWYQTGGGSLCEDCSLHDPVERSARRRTELLASAEAAR
jgi:ferric iron reductase protein FhuF